MSVQVVPDLTWWNYLHYNISTCVRTNPAGTVSWMERCDRDTVPSSPPVSTTPSAVVQHPSSDPSSFFTSIWFIIFLMLIVVLVLLLLTAVFAIWRFHDQNRGLREKLASSERNLRSQNEYFTAKLQRQMEEQLRVSEEHQRRMEDITQRHAEHALSRANHEQEPRKEAQPPQIHVLPVQSLFVPNYWETGDAAAAAAAAGRDGLAGARVADNGQTAAANDTTQTGPRNSLPIRLPANDTPYPQGDEEPHGGSEQAETEHKKPDGVSPINLGDIDEEGVTNASSAESARSGRMTNVYGPSTSRLANDHPATRLPPVDLLFLVDSSSSIGNVAFTDTKNALCRLIEDVDVAAGRSRIACVQFAKSPVVAFPFDRYYSHRAISRAIKRLSYLGGPTMLARALHFAAGLLYGEQNLRSSPHRRHQLAPTPRHDTLQVLVLVSDGHADDKPERSLPLIHDKLQVKVCALATQSIYRARLAGITRFEGGVFLLSQQEAFNLWLWRQQTLWADNYRKWMTRERQQPLPSARRRLLQEPATETTTRIREERPVGEKKKRGDEPS